MRVISNADIAALLPMRAAVEVIDLCMRAVSRGEVQLPLRHVVPLGGANLLGVMSGAFTTAPGAYGAKLLSLFPGNPAKGISGHRGALVIFEPEEGAPVAMMDAGLITAIRTAAASAVATRALAPEGAARLTILGTGEQAEHHLEAMRAVRPITALHVVGRTAEAAARFAANAAARHPDLAIRHGIEAEGAVKEAEIICTVTSSKTPVLRGEWLMPGQHLNVAGASLPSKREIDDAAVLRAAIWCDYRPSFFAQAGEIVETMAAGRITEGHLRGEIGAVLAGAAPGRDGPEAITLYRSLGIMAQDLAAGWHVAERAAAEGRGVLVPFG